MNDHAYMARAVELAERGIFTTTPNPNVGCVLVRDNEIVGEGWHQKAGDVHAELHALQMAGPKARGATAYVTLEPCSHTGRTGPCCEALIQAGVSRVVVAMQDPNPLVAGRGLDRLQQAGIPVSHGLLSEQAWKLNRGFLKRMRTGLPWVSLKMGTSLDGRTAMASGESQWITCKAARQDVQRLRAASCAILTSAATVLADDPALTVRRDELDEVSALLLAQQPELRQPIRVLLDRKLQVPADRRLFAQPGTTWRFSHTNKVTPLSGVVDFYLPEHQGHSDLVALMVLLGNKQINQVWVEAGARLAGALLTAGVVDELIVYQSPKLLGDKARGLCVLPAIHLLSEAIRFKYEQVTQIGDDLRIILRPE